MENTTTKTLSLMVFTAAISALLMYWYMSNANATTTPPATSQPTTPSTSICEDYDTENMSTLDVDLVHTMVNGYRNNQLNFIKTNSSFKAPDDAHSIWFDLITLKKFLYHIENISKKEKNIDVKKLGVRIYYAAYPVLDKYEGPFKDLKVMRDDPEKSKYGALHTLVMIPTIENSAGVSIDFNPLDTNTYDIGIGNSDVYDMGSAAVIPNSNPIPEPNSTAALSASRNGASQNHGLLIPPAASSFTPTTPGAATIYLEGF